MSVEHIDGKLSDALDDPCALGDELTRVFTRMQEAIGQGDEVVIRVLAEDLLGHRGPVQAAYVNGLLGMCRAVAFEGGSKGWKANVVAVPSDMELSIDELASVVAHPSMTGQIVTLGTIIVGRLAP